MGLKRCETELKNKMNIEAKKIKEYLIWPFIIIVLVVGKEILFLNERQRALGNNFDYTYGTVTHFSKDGSLNKMIHYYYVIDNHKYEGKSFSDARVFPNLGDKYLVKYSKKYPETHELIMYNNGKSTKK